MARWTNLSAAEIATKSAANRAARKANVVWFLEKAAMPQQYIKRLETPAEKPPKTRQKAPAARPAGKVIPKAASKRKIVPTEHEEQAKVIKWWNIYAPLHRIPEVLLFAIPNGANKSIASAVKFKREGLRKGIPDLCLAKACGKYHGLYIEMKRLLGSRTSVVQSAVHGIFRLQGYCVIVCNTADRAIEAIEDYLRG